MSSHRSDYSSCYRRQTRLVVCHDHSKFTHYDHLAWRLDSFSSPIDTHSTQHNFLSFYEVFGHPATTLRTVPIYCILYALTITRRRDSDEIALYPSFRELRLASDRLVSVNDRLRKRFGTWSEWNIYKHYLGSYSFIYSQCRLLVHVYCTKEANIRVRSLRVLGGKRSLNTSRWKVDHKNAMPPLSSILQSMFKSIFGIHTLVLAWQLWF